MITDGTATTASAVSYAHTSGVPIMGTITYGTSAGPDYCATISYNQCDICGASISNSKQLCPVCCKKLRALLTDIGYGDKEDQVFPPF